MLAVIEPRPLIAFSTYPLFANIVFGTLIGPSNLEYCPVSEQRPFFFFSHLYASSHSLIIQGTHRLALSETASYARSIAKPARGASSLPMIVSPPIPLSVDPSSVHSCAPLRSIILCSHRGFRCPSRTVISATLRHSVDDRTQYIFLISEPWVDQF